MHPDDRPQLPAGGFLYSLGVETYRNGRKQRAFMQKGCILICLGFSMKARVKSRLGDCYNSPSPDSLLPTPSLPVSKRGHYLMLLYNDDMRQPAKDITDKGVILFTKNSKSWQVVRPDPKSKNVKVSILLIIWRSKCLRR